MSYGTVRAFKPAQGASPLEPLPQRDAHVESSVPLWFFVTADTLAMGAAFVLNLILAPTLQHLVAPGGPLRFDWLNWLDFPGGHLQTSPTLAEALGLLAVTVPVTLIAIGLMGGYQPLDRVSRTRLFAPAVVGPIVALGTFALAIFALRQQDQWSRILIFSNTVLVIISLVGYRIALRTYKLKRMAAGRYTRTTALVGRPADLGRILDRLTATHFGAHCRPVGCFTTDEPGSSQVGLPWLGPISQLGASLVHTPIDMVIVVLPDRDTPWLADVIKSCDYMRVAVQVIPATLVDLAPTLRDLRVLSDSGAVALPGIHLQPRNIDSGALFLKRLFDVSVAAVLLLILSPLFLLIAIAIKLTTPRQNVFYRWRVIGYQGRPFTGYKFTTMVDDADQRRAELVHLNEMTGPVFKIKNDPRVTPLGKLLRKFSLNELPQLWSVLVGDMSLVGPRPAGAWEIGNYEDWHKRKLSFRPGITCLWQVSGRNKISNFDDWVRMDLEYIDNWSLWLDTRILIRTAWVVVAGSGS
jgi:exopolysaccharide biosynthesis polyprenyl glycosylphosphotransferase